jgi:hypothetical protein
MLVADAPCVTMNTNKQQQNCVCFCRHGVQGQHTMVLLEFVGRWL